MLTPRQAQIMGLHASGMNAFAIARTEYLSVHTVRGHMADVRERLGARSLAHATALCVAREIIVQDEHGNFVVPARDEMLVA